MRYFVSQKRHIQKGLSGWYFYNNDDRHGKDSTVKRNRIRLAKQEGCTWLQHNLLYISFQSSADYDVNSRGPLVALSQGTCLFGF